MSKELEALEDIAIYNCNGVLQISDTEEYEIIKKALQRLEAIDNAKPSEALECLEELGTHRIEYREGFELGYTKTMPFKSTIEYKIIQQTLLKAQEQKKKNAKYEVVKKALKNGIYAKDPLDENKLNYIPAVALSNVGDEWYLSNHCDFCVNVRDYKELFWLKKDKSE